MPRKKAEEKVEDSDNFGNLADDIFENLNDKEWAKKVYKKAEGKSEDSDDFCDLADKIFENLEDKEWTKEVYKKAEEKVEDSDDFRDLANNILEKLGDKEWAKEVYNKSGGKTHEFTVTWEVKYYEDNASYTTDEDFEAENLDKLIDELDKGLEQGHYTPESNVPFHEGDFNIEYVVIRSWDGQEVYRDDDYVGDNE